MNDGPEVVMKFSLLLASLLMIAGYGCATSMTAQDYGPNETCYVCRYNNDLACVHIHPNEKTARAEYNGTTYYFCSEGCRDEFLKKPTKYLPASQKPRQ
jgi:YHS domain-containing protein